MFFFRCNITKLRKSNFFKKIVAPGPHSSHGSAPRPRPPANRSHPRPAAATSSAGGGGEADYEVSDDHRAAWERHEQSVQELL